MERNLIILRGLSGSGKTTLAKVISRAVCSADDYLVDSKGNYNWHWSKLKSAHNWCYRKCERFLKKGINPVVVANTNAPERELRPYFDLGRRYGYRVFSVIVENRHDGINEHDVPEETIAKMEKRFNIKLR